MRLNFLSQKKARTASVLVENYIEVLATEVLAFARIDIKILTERSQKNMSGSLYLQRKFIFFKKVKIRIWQSAAMTHLKSVGVQNMG
jgi:hypothetical protein